MAETENSCNEDVFGAESLSAEDLDSTASTSVLPTKTSDQNEAFFKSNQSSFEDLFGSDSDDDSLFRGFTFKNIFGGSSLFGDSDGESQKSPLEAVVEGDLAHTSTTDDGDDWPAPPDLAENSDVLSTVRNLALENFDIILQRSVSERSSELRELQNSARPVTGTDARDNISTFLTRATNPDADVSQQQRTSLPDDVQNLIQRSIVTTALRRHGFRAALEQSLSSRLTPAAALRSNIISRNSSARSVSGMSTPSMSQQELDAMSVVSDATTDHNDNSDAASDIEQLQRVLGAGVQVLSETIEEDLQQLHHLHVVSSVLDGGFRDNLERLFQERAMRVGGGELVQQFIRSLPPGQRPQRVPSRANAAPPPGRSNFPFTSQPRNMHVTSEVRSLKEQMAEMRQMLQMTYEMQMDTQRAIRQEVSAVFSAFMQQMSQGSSAELPAHQTTMPSRNPSPVSAGSCVICFERQVDSVLYQCGHMCACHACGMHLKMQGHRCPMCRAPIQDVIRAYKAQ